MNPERSVTAAGDVTLTISGVLLTLAGGLSSMIPLDTPVNLTLTLRAAAGLSGTIAIAAPAS